MAQAILLSRVSTIGQDLEQQTQAVLKMCKVDGFDNPIVIEDKESAVLLSEEERNGLNELKRLVTNNKDIKCVYAYEISRISRRAEVNYSIRNFLRDNHVQLKILTPSITVFNEETWEVNAEANLMYSLFAALAENEGYIRKQRFARAKAKKKAEGKFVGGTVLYGYKTDEDKHFIIDEEKAAVVKRIFKLYLTGQYSGRQIGELLYKEGTISQTNRATRDTFVCKILRNEKYTGCDIYPQIIPEIDFQTAQPMLSAGQIKPRTKYKENIYYGHKLLFIKDSNRQMMVRKSDAAYIEPVSGFCISMNMVDSLLLHCSDYAYKQHGLGDYEKLQEKYEDELKSLNKRIVNYDKEEEKIRKSIDKLETRIIYGKISEEAAQSLSTKLEEDLKNVSVSRKEDLNLRSSLEKSLEAIQRESGKEIDVYSMTDKEQYDFIRGEIAKVEVMRVKNSHYLMMVIYKNPLIDCQIYNIYSKKHKFTLYDEDVDVKFIKRFEYRK